MLLEMCQVLYCFGPAYAADVAPVLVRGMFEPLAKPLDAGHSFRGRPILGSHKTWRGLVFGVIAGSAAYELQGLLYEFGWLRELALVDYHRQSVLPGLLMGFGAIAGDSIKSFFKRQLGIPSGSSWLVFDQLDFFFGSSLLLSMVQPLPLLPWVAVLPIVFVCDVIVAALAYTCGLKDAWI
jgi:CDP-2,3-bis-(O-geranylgeranyl)-sn-glycerol synthase